MTPGKILQRNKANNDVAIGTEDPANVLVLQNGNNYKIACLVGLPSGRYVPQIAVLDTGAGPNLIRANVLPPDWRSQGLLVPATPRHVRDANGRLMATIGTIRTPCRIANYTAMTDFLVVERLAVPLILGCDYIDKNIATIRPAEGIINFVNESQASLLIDSSPSCPPQPLRIVTTTTLPPQSETQVLVSTPASGLCYLKSKPAPISEEQYPTTHLLAEGLADVKPDIPFRVLMLNTGQADVRLHTNERVGIATPGLADILLLSGDPRFDIEDDVDLPNLMEVDDDESDDDEGDTERDETPEGKSLTTTWEAELQLDHLDIDDRVKVLQLLRPHSAMWNGSLGEISVTEHRIDLTPEARPMYQAPYRAGRMAREIERAEVDKMLNAGVIEPATSEWASPVVLITKKDGSVRFCVDYRKLNSVTIRDTYPLPRMDECLDSLGDASIFTTLDCNSGYWQIPVRNEDRDKTAFVTHVGVHRFKRMPFGLCNAPATFQRALDMILAQVKWRNALVYLDDVIIYSHTIQEHYDHVNFVLHHLRQAGVSLQLKKCHFFQPRVDYLGHVVTPGKLAVAQKNVDTLAQAKHPQTRTELRSFLGMCNVYRRFVPHFAKKASPLTELLKKGQPSEYDDFTEEQAEAFDALRQALINPPILALPRQDAPFTLDVDASDYQLGACLLQEQDDGQLAPCGYFSKTLLPAERNYSAVEKECLAVVWAILQLRPYLERVRFTVRSDQVALRWLLSLKDPSGRLARWRLRLAEFDFTIQYRPGVKNSIADGCSRVRSSGSDTLPCDDSIPCYIADESDDEYDGTPPELDCLPPAQPQASSPVTLEELHKAQQEDADCREWLEFSKQKDSPFFTVMHNRLQILYRRAALDGQRQICVPTSLRPRVLYLTHYPPTAGHPGGRKMYQTLRRTYYWPSMALESYSYLRSCYKCTQEQLASKHARSPMKLFPASGPLEYVAIDILGPLPRTKQGNQYLLVIADRFSKLVRTVPLKRITALSVAQAFANEWVCVYGPPLYLLSDNGTQFKSSFFKDICQRMGTRQFFTSPYHPQTNGQVERFNRTLLAQLRAFVSDDQTSWDYYSPSVTFAYNTQVHTATGFTPFELILSRPPPPSGLDIETFLDDPVLLDDATAGTRGTNRTDFLTRLQSQVARVRANIDKIGRRYKLDKDATVRPVNPECLVGKRVFLRREVRAHKLDPLGTGPHTVTWADDKTAILEGPRGPVKVSRDRITNPVDDDNRAFQLSNPQNADVSLPPAGRAQTFGVNDVEHLQN